MILTCIDVVGNAGPSVTVTPITVDLTKPTVTINQEIGQADPTNNATVSYTVVFSEPIDPTTFIAVDIDITGSTTTGTTVDSVTQIAPNDDTTFEVEISVTLQMVHSALRQHLQVVSTQIQ